MDPVSPVLSALSGLESYIPEPISKAADFARSLTSSSDDVTVSLSTEYQDLINKQIEVQEQLQQTTFISNIEKAGHETKMAPIRNLNVN